MTIDTIRDRQYISDLRTTPSTGLYTSKPGSRSSPYNPGAYANIWQGERSGMQGRTPWTSTFWSNTVKD